jgi:hypothetical protein
MTKTDRPFAGGVPDTYGALCRVHMPRPIHDKVAYENTLEIVDALAGRELNPDQEDYLQVILCFVPGAAPQTSVV